MCLKYSFDFLTKLLASTTHLRQDIAYTDIRNSCKKVILIIDMSIVN